MVNCKICGSSVSSTLDEPIDFDVESWKLIFLLIIIILFCIFLLVMPKYWGKLNFSLRSYPEVGQKQWPATHCKRHLGWHTQSRLGQTSKRDRPKGSCKNILVGWTNISQGGIGNTIIGVGTLVLCSFPKMDNSNSRQIQENCLPLVFLIQGLEIMLE